MTLLENFLRQAQERRAEGRCPTCNRSIKQFEFRNTLSQREFQISGLCQNCQDRVFGPDEELS